jgi:hypothetical protein
VSLEHLNTFVSEASNFPNIAWTYAGVQSVSRLDLPDAVTSRNHMLLKTDAHSLWLRWFIEGICAPTRYVEDLSKSEAHIYQDALHRVNELFPSETKPLKEGLATSVSKYVMQEVNRLRNQERTFASSKKRLELIDSSMTPRCWICGYAFSQAAIDKFLQKRGANNVELPVLVDIFRPRGLKIRDVCIEVEHILPVASGGLGDDNLALACGWCNRYKGARTSIYDVSSRPPKVKYLFANQTFYELPHPFWTVRLLAIRGTCEHIDGCEHSAQSAEMFIAPSTCGGTPNPSNLHVFCEYHDPFPTERLVSIDEARRIWEDRKKQLKFLLKEN